MQIVKYIPGVNYPEEVKLFKKHFQNFDCGIPYAEMIRKRISGDYKKECTDIYLFAFEKDVFISRLWYGWGRHENAVGNFGNFYTEEFARGKGIGGKLLEQFENDINSRNDLPLGLFCTAGSERLTSLYKKFGFTLALDNSTFGPLYKPLGNSPKTFREFCESYYSETNSLHFKPASAEFRHEIDCLLKFALLNYKLPYAFENMPSFEQTLLNANNGKAEIILTDSNRVVGWTYTDCNSIKKIIIHPLYKNIL